MGRGPIACRCHVDFARIGFGIGNELGNRLGRKRGVYLNENGLTDNAGDRRNVTDKIEIELVVERRARRIGYLAWAMKSSTILAASLARGAGIAMHRYVTSSRFNGACFLQDRPFGFRE
jgi:hypothetical protein